MLHDLWPLHRLLKRRGYTLSIESNGTIEIPDGLLDWICVSPKDQVYTNSVIRQRMGNELKVVYCGQHLDMYDDLKVGFEFQFEACETLTSNPNPKRYSNLILNLKCTPNWNLIQIHLCV